jgi:molybdopterin-guanine dinucleotide biosynthesis protein A
MGVVSKALAELNGVPLIRHVVQRLQPQVSSLIVSVDEVNPAFEAMGLIQAVDPRPGQQGPLGGLLAALEEVHENYEWLLLTPCDAPFLPTDLGERLHQRAAASGLPGQVR